ncbi:MAG: pentapeptide repeat-containing protein [Nostoc sp. DedVER02]|uniref:pentapeptide repeat-containing protein n=1 Tax=unclassified Nostoc TaxID=2593658 RepID=UPI002AD2237B|nr:MULTISPECIES: pentapeptide repeat-containing protein [unclassified Nostoc]MDZ7988558.1 pentapeptide repeat-containing protein [Nostoc sp. DedVER02]MDZ8112258.1 pentapeptide repeat-containing protein [Nostoc sp. DedVER01b]
MKYWRLIASCVLAMVLFLFPLSAEAASSSSITRSVGNDELKGKDYSGQSLIGTEFTNLKLENANFSNADLRGTVFNGTLLEGVNLHGVNFSEGIAYLSRFKAADLSDAVLTDAMMLRSTFDDVNVTGADFTNAILDGTQVKKLCVKASGVNSKTGVDTRESLGCK